MKVQLVGGALAKVQLVCGAPVKVELFGGAPVKLLIWIGDRKKWKMSNRKAGGRNAECHAQSRQLVFEVDHPNAEKAMPISYLPTI